MACPSLEADIPTFDTEATASGLIDFIDSSPSPFHAVETATNELVGAGYTLVQETDAFPTEPGKYCMPRGGSLIAWNTEHADGPATRFRVVGAHTDSPNFRIKTQPDHVKAGMQMLGVEMYGGALANSWLDRDLGISGRVAVRDGEGRSERLFRCDDPILRFSQLAIHLDRDIYTEGVKLNPQLHMVPHWGIGDTAADFKAWLAGQVGAKAEDILGWDAMTHDVVPSRKIGRDSDLIAAPRLDNQATCYAGLQALLRAEAPASPQRQVFVMFDHEEIGSTSERGAASTFLPAVLERIVLASGGTKDDYWRALAGSVIASGDMAHATHPNYIDRHEPQHHIALGGGPVIKINVKMRYATDSRGEAALRLACDQAGVPLQTYIHRNDLPCGSTVGPVTAALSGATTVDLGAPMLSMHSIRELAAVPDQAMYAKSLAAFFAPH